ncbi:MAG: UDP-N-acetylmuramate dehydrogenase [Nitrospirae bacterium]|nr:UDP-N-acetylmuramate dehydrogenase [Nitrospirota bacterium]
MEIRRRDIAKVEYSTNSGDLMVCKINCIETVFKMKEEWKVLFYEEFLRNEARFGESMSNHTSLRIGGPADIFLIPEDISSLKKILNILKRNRIPFLPLGNGTNILVMDEGIEGAVISLRSFRKMEIINEDDKFVNIYVESGFPLQKLVRFSKECGYSGIEGLVGIPGSIGGAVWGNAGAYGYEMKDIITLVTIMGSDGRIREVRSEDIEFGYRGSKISSFASGGEMVISVEIVLKKDKIENVSSKIEDFFKRKRESQPIFEPSAGCVFKNPPELSAGRLIDEAGCKGMRIGDVEVSKIHANFFVNKGKAKASEFIKLMENVKLRVIDTSGIELEPEIRIVGRG